MARAAREVPDQRLGPMEVPVQDSDVLEAGTDEHRHHGARPAAGTEHHRVARPLALHPGENRFEAGADAIGIGVVAAQATIVTDEDVDRAADAGVVRQCIRQRRGLLLVRRRDQRAREVVAGSQLAQRVGQLVRPALPALDLDRRSDRLQGGPQDALVGVWSSG